MENTEQELDSQRNLFSQWMADAAQYPVLSPKEESRILKEISDCRKDIRKRVRKMGSQFKRDFMNSIPEKDIPGRKRDWKETLHDPSQWKLFASSNGEKYREFLKEINPIIAKMSREIGNLVSHNQRFVMKLAKSYGERGIPVLDLIQEGNLGLIRAAIDFRPDRKFKFLTYAYWWIRHFQGRACASQGRTVRIPGSVLDSMPLFHEAWNQIAAREKRDPTELELRAETHLSPGRVTECLILFMSSMSDSYQTENLGEDFPSLTQDSPDSLLLDQEERTGANEILFTLPPLFALSARIHYGAETPEIPTINPVPAWRILRQIRNSGRELHAKLFKNQ